VNETPTEGVSSFQHCHKKEFKSSEQYSLSNAITSGGHYVYGVNYFIFINYPSDIQIP
jgi:hypothetical protein